MKIATKILASVSVLSVLLMGVSLSSARKSLQSLTAVQRLAEVDRVSAALFQASSDWAVERGVVNFALASGAAERDRLAAAAARRESGDRAFAAALAAGRALTVDPAARTALARAEESKRGVERLRLEAEAALRVGPATAVRERWFPAMTELIGAAQELRMVLEASSAGQIDTALQQTMDARASLWRVGEYAGRERGLIAGAVGAGKPMTVQQADAVGRTHGQIDAALENAVFRHGPDAAALGRVADAFSAAYQEHVAGVRARILDASATGEPYPVTAIAWFDSASKAVDAALAAHDAAARTVSARIAEAEQRARTGFLVDAVVAVVALLAALAAGWTVLARVIRPLRGLVDCMRTLAQGEYGVDVPHRGDRDEVGAMADAVEVFKQNGLENHRLVAAQERERAAAERAKREALQAMAQTVEREAAQAAARVAEQGTRMDGDAAAMARSAEDVSRDAQSVAAAATQALHAAETVAAASEELTGSIREISGQVSHASQATRRAVELGGNAKEAIVSLSNTVTRIGDVAMLIRSVASQTNLLALNATIEAARAGEHGKGFAVVANEVKGLARQTSQATEDISAQIGDVQAATHAAVEAVRAIEADIREIDEVAGAIAAAVEEQASATQEIARNVTETADAAREVSSRIAKVSGEAAETGQRSRQVRQGAEAVARGVEALRDTVVQTVRAATA